jgi:hypothetical protein
MGDTTYNRSACSSSTLEYIWAVNKNLGIVADIEKKRSEWISHTARLNHGRVVNTIFESKLEGRRTVGRPRRRWLIRK